MPNYKESFELNPNDIDMIEQALRSHAALQSIKKGINQVGEMATSSQKIRQVHELLGKLHNQKIFYACANKSGCPAG